MLNKVMLIGNLGADPEVRYFPDGTPTATVTIATSESWIDKVSNEKREKTEWHRVVFFRGLAGVVAEHLKKGARIYVEGKLRTRKWQDNNGVDRYTTEVVAEEMRMLGKKPASDVPTAPRDEAPPTDLSNLIEDDLPY